MNEIENITQKLKKIDAGNILDVATGGGEFIYSLEKSFNSFKTIIGVDISEKAIEFANKKFEDNNKIEFQIKDALNLDFPDESFDIITISNSLHHFNDPKKVISEMFRVLKKGGFLIISEMHSDDDQSQEQQTHVRLHHWWGKIDSLNEVVHNRTFKSKEFIDILKDFKFKNIEKYKFSYPTHDPKDKDTLKHLNKVIDMYIKRIPNSKENQDLVKEGEYLRVRVAEVGFESASRVFFIGKK